MPEPLRLVTERLVLTPFDPDRDWSSFLSDIVLDPTVSAAWADLRDGGLTDADRERLAADEFLPWFEEGRAVGLIAWTLRTFDGDFVGVSGLMVSGPPGAGAEPEFGSMLAARWHGRGLATEAGRAILRDGWGRLGVQRIVAVMDSPNPASRRLVDKLGFRLETVEFDDANRPYVRFVVEPPSSVDGVDPPFRR